MAQLTGPLLFDLDGTVIDSVALIRESHRHAVTTVLGTDLSDEELVANVGRPLLDQMRHFSADHADRLLHVYREWNHAHTAALLRAYDGVDSLLAQLAGAGHRLGVVTSKSHPVVELAWQVLPGVREQFEVIVAAEDTARHKPDPAPVLHALGLMDAPPQGACYIGDAPFDILAGRAAGVHTIGVTWGFFSRSALSDAGADVIVDTPQQLADVILGQG